MKKLFLSLLVGAIISTGAISAQNKSENKEPRKSQGTMKELNLTAEQKEQIKNLNKEFKVKQKELATQHRENINSVLTPDQQTKLAELKKERKESIAQKKGKVSMHKKHGKSRFDEITQTKLKNLRENFKNEVSAVEKSRVAPEEQERRKAELQEKFKTDRKQIIKEYRDSKKEKKQTT